MEEKNGTGWVSNILWLSAHCNQYHLKVSNITIENLLYFWPETQRAELRTSIATGKWGRNPGKVRVREKRSHKFFINSFQKSLAVDHTYIGKTTSRSAMDTRSKLIFDLLFQRKYALNPTKLITWQNNNHKNQHSLEEYNRIQSVHYITFTVQSKTIWHEKKKMRSIFRRKDNQPR